MKTREEMKKMFKEQELQKKVVTDFINLVRDDKLNDFVNNASPKSGSYLVDLDRKYEGYIGLFCNNSTAYYVDTRTDYINIRKEGIYIKEILPDDVSLEIYNCFKNIFENVEKEA
ncbi:MULTISPECIES: hypothetical protein [Peptoniphilus]|uniref:Uncharacterized protein n=1 Tax=Peptoniphilus harei TaxID=54005 RepID=A0A943XU75_9FIRM|nr:hypothetical protein [Peptoniphilus harei]MBS6535649.1 hypothetical protein [Peptoniphilus harei]